MSGPESPHLMSSAGGGVAKRRSWFHATNGPEGPTTCRLSVPRLVVGNDRDNLEVTSPFPIFFLRFDVGRVFRPAIGGPKGPPYIR